MSIADDRRIDVVVAKGRRGDRRGQRAEYEGGTNERAQPDTPVHLRILTVWLAVASSQPNASQPNALAVITVLPVPHVPVSPTTSADQATLSPPELAVTPRYRLCDRMDGPMTATNAG
jgi:hypothetical protein